MFKRNLSFIWNTLELAFVLLLSLHGQAQIENMDSLMTKAEQWKVKTLLKGVSVNVYLDAYYIGNIGGTIPTNHVYEFQTTCPLINEARINMFGILINYNTSWSRLTGEFRVGDEPLLMASSAEKWTSFLNQATVGFRLAKGLWVDCGYLISQVGAESTSPMDNLLSTCSVGAFYEPKSVLGGILTYTTGDQKWQFSLWVGNLYSLPSGKNIHVQYGLDATYNPTTSLTFSFNNYMGNTAPSGSDFTKYLAFNNLYLTWNPSSDFSLIGQVDLAFQNFKHFSNDSTALGAMTSAQIGGRYYFIPKLALAARGEMFYDPKQIFIGDKFTGSTGHFMIFGASGGLEFNPGKNAYVRAEYSWLSTGDPGVKPFNEVSSSTEGWHYWADFYRQSFVITTGIRF